MSRTRLVASIGAGLAIAGLAGTRLVRRILRQMDSVAPPTGWSTPRWDDGDIVMVPTDDDAELLVMRAGSPETDKTVVLVHGITSDHHCWAPIARELANDDCRLIALNQRGHGGSTIGSDGFAAGRLGADLGIVLEALDIERAIVVGHSMGGAAALSLTTSGAPGSDRIAAMVLVATLAGSKRPDRNLLLRVQFHGLFDRLKRDDHHAPALTRVVFGSTPSRELVDDLLTMTRRCPTATATAAARGMLTYDVGGQLSSVDLATTVICGTRDIVTTHRENGAIASAMPNATFRSVPDAGHMVIWEEPMTIVDSIRGHLAEHREEPIFSS